MGLSRQACLSFDVACVTFDERFQEAREATKEVPLTPEEIRAREKHIPTKTEKLYDLPELLYFLGLGEEDKTEAEIFAGFEEMATAADWFQSGGLGVR